MNNPTSRLDTTWIMIPARGGSRGVPRKNVRLLGGLPLIVHVIRAALSRCDATHIAVITDDDEIDAIARAEGIVVVREEKTSGLATLDDVAMKVAAELRSAGAREDDIFLTVQPTCPFVQPGRLDETVAAFEAGAGSVITVVDDRHLGWFLDATGEPVPDYKARVNRQKLPSHFRETGAIIGCRFGDLEAQKTRIVAPIRLVEIDKHEALDIDDFSDWAIAEYVASRRSIVIRADASERLGMGHVYRALALAQELARHKVVIATDGAMSLGRTLLDQYPFEVTSVAGNGGFIELVQQLSPDLVILDQLDTTADYVEAVKAASHRVVTFEDQGSGAVHADLVVADLYQNLNVPDDRQLTGLSNAILSPSFETARSGKAFSEQVGNVLVVFGGTDPAGLTERALQALAASSYDGEVSVVIGPGVKRAIDLQSYGLRGQTYSNVKFMPALMAKADLAISSAGRTITELVSLGVPVLCLCQNEKELTHTHASARYGVINLGLGELVDPKTLAAHIERLIASSALRNTLHVRALHETRERSNAAIIGRISRHIGWQNT
jgi:spore coat polysaccharide biosynthesis predicted glycosyltransferase SpsG/CMP-N-acetylneuraminic acid synthetase